jgi:hypothetical protein
MKKVMSEKRLVMNDGSFSDDSLIRSVLAPAGTNLRRTREKYVVRLIK